MTDVPPLLTKQCPKCSEWKSEADFQKGHPEACKTCMSKVRRAAYSTPEARKRRREQVEALRLRIVVPDEQVCTCCNVVKPKSDFYTNRRRLSGLTVHCAECMKKSAAQRKENPEFRAVRSIKDKTYRKNSLRRKDPGFIARRQEANRFKSLKLRIAVEICQRLSIDLDALVKERLDALRTNADKVQ